MNDGKNERTNEWMNECITKTSPYIQMNAVGVDFFQITVTNKIQSNQDKIGIR